MKSHATTADRNANSHAAANDRCRNTGAGNWGLIAPDLSAQKRYASMIDGSPYIISQRKRIRGLAEGALQIPVIHAGVTLIPGPSAMNAASIQLERTPGGQPNRPRMPHRTKNASAGDLHIIQPFGAYSGRDDRNSNIFLLPAGQGVIQRIPFATATAAAGNAEELFWVVKPKRDYLKQAHILEVQGDLEAQNLRARVRFSLGGDEAWVGLSDIYPLDSDELEDLPSMGAVGGALKRLIRKGGSGTAMGDVFNTAGVLSATSALVSQSSGWFITGIVSGVGVFIGGTTQIIRALALRDKSATDRTFEGAKGVLNMLSGGLGIAANILGLTDISGASTVTGIFSLDAWMYSELLNIFEQGPGALDDLADKQVTPRLASVLFSTLKIIGGNVLVNGAAFSSNPALIAGMVIAGGGTLAGFILGMIKLAKMAFHHYSKNRPVEQQTGELEEVVVE